jgi:hypothetical protein
MRLIYAVNNPIDAVFSQVMILCGIKRRGRMMLATESTEKIEMKNMFHESFLSFAALFFSSLRRVFWVLHPTQMETISFMLQR